MRGKNFPVRGCRPARRSQENIWVATKQGLYVFKSDGTCSYVKDMRDYHIHMMAAASPYALLLDVVNQGLALYDVRTERYKILHKNEKTFLLNERIYR